MITQPQPNDILCGKSKTCIHHAGSKRFRAIIEAYSPKYQNALTKYDKMTITREIYESVKQTSRFLKFKDDAQIWEEISSENARDKIGHSLRFANRTTKRKFNSNNSKKTHRRTGSGSSQCSDSTDSTCSSGYSQDSILALFQNQYAPDPVHSSSSSVPIMEPLVDDFLDCHFIPSEQDRSIDDLMQLLEETENVRAGEDPLLGCVEDIVNDVQNLDFSEPAPVEAAAPQVEEEQDNLAMCLLAAPIVGEF